MQHLTSTTGPVPETAESAGILAVLVAAKLDKPLCYRNEQNYPFQQGDLVQVPLGRRKTTAIVLGPGEPDGDYALKPLGEPIAPGLRLPADLIELLKWTARYYHAPIGQVLSTALPKSLLDGKPVVARRNPRWRAQPDPAATATTKQQQLLQWLAEHGSATTGDILDAGFGRHLIKAVRDKSLITQESEQRRSGTPLAQSPQPPNDEQQRALAEIRSAGGPRVFLLYGVTGSGKTEVYLHAMQDHLERDEQVLFLVPEIGLIHQTLERVQARFNLPVLGYHSAATEAEKIQCWQDCASGKPLVVVGTRSAIFLPFTRLGIILVDEEQDLSYKQFDGIRYNARDLAIIRTRTPAQTASSPGTLILGSATPSLESLHNVERGNSRLLELRQRVEQRPLPQWQIVTASPTGLAPMATETLNRIDAELRAGGQVLVFLNRRGYAPQLACPNCAWTALCRACDTQMTVHQQPRALICHRCDGYLAIPESCPGCGSRRLTTRGTGTEQLESFLSKCFPTAACLRIDRDSTQRKNALAEKLEQLKSGQPTLLIGTQMITKGHHLPGISLVVALGADTALYSHDYRALEHLTQSLIQVAGRAGRGSRPGTIIIETAQPEHPVLHDLTHSSYEQIARQLLQQRQRANLPPLSQAAVLHASCTDLGLLNEFMDRASRCLGQAGVHSIGPMPSVIERKAGRYRYQIQLYADNRSALHSQLAGLEATIGQLRGFSKIRWTIDVDPLTMD